MMTKLIQAAVVDAMIFVRDFRKVWSSSAYNTAAITILYRMTPNTAAMTTANCRINQQRSGKDIMSLIIY